jgi:hypothetical protein
MRIEESRRHGSAFTEKHWVRKMPDRGELSCCGDPDGGRRGQRRAAGRAAGQDDATWWTVDVVLAEVGPALPASVARDRERLGPILEQLPSSVCGI